MSKIYYLNDFIKLIFIVSFISACSQEPPPTAELVEVQTGVQDLKYKYYSSAEKASDAFMQALEHNEDLVLQSIFGNNYMMLIPVTNKAEQVTLFVKKWHESHAIEYDNDNDAYIVVGEKRWVFPVPITKDKNGWYFDTEKGKVTILQRTIGKNELFVIKACLAYRADQEEYFKEGVNSSRGQQFAQTLISAADNEYALYSSALNNKSSGSLEKQPDVQFSGKPYAGYKYKILTSQGDSANGGAMSYITANKMISGYGILAWPERYGVSGVMSFMLNRDGVIYEANLGSSGNLIAESLMNYNPDDNWQPINQVFY